MDVKPNDPAWKLARQIARFRAEQLLKLQDEENVRAQFLPTTVGELDAIREGLEQARDTERHALIVLLNHAIDDADAAKNKKLSHILSRICDRVSARGTSTEIALAQ